MNNWILNEVIESLKNRLSTLEKMIQDEGFQPIYKAAMKQEIIFIKNELEEINQMMLEEVGFMEAAEEDYRGKKFNAYI